MSQHDLEIANQAFPATRADLNNALLAIARKQAGASAPPTPRANGWWYETGTEILHIRNAANDAWIPFALIDQSAGTVAIALDADGDSYVMAMGDDVLRVTLGGAASFDLTATGIKTLLATLTLLDANGNEALVLEKVASAVNYLSVLSAATGNGVEVAAKGGDTNVDLVLKGKGSGVPKLDGGSGLLDRGRAAKLSVGYTESATGDGTKSSGSYTPDPDTGTLAKSIVNGGAFTLSPPTPATNEVIRMTVFIENNASAGAITMSFTRADGDDFTTTDGDRFVVEILVL
jgi:hypothetical protein